ncbi:type IV toxin-antitoxin system AbiEi family antitoxin domain-containing protein [Streptomyces phaeoluteigriseus]|uniref:type IV toxin-antitoxin system AbiEi family antitoxin domain-containing protein n=1 Tax=Streptomyces phaeoluteigriseus TaxID=114686 RepID=UPI0036B63D36
MNHNTPLPQASARPLRHLSEAQRRVLTTAQLRSHGVSPAELTERCRSGGPWQQLLPGVYLLHPGAPTSEERLHAVLLYAAREVTAPGVPAQPEPGQPHRPVYREAMITGLAALTLHGFTSAPPLLSLDRIDVLVPRLRRLRSTGCAHVLRAASLPAPEEATGVPVAPVPRALADAVSQLTDAGAVRRLLSEAVRGGHCEPAVVVRELNNAKLLSRPHVVDAVDSLLAEGRAIAEDRLYTMVREFGLPDPVWNVDLRLPGGPHLGGLDAYWPEQAVAVELDTRAPRQDEDALWSEYARKREHLERLGITVVHITPRKLRDGMEQQAAVVRTALMASGDRDPAAYVVVLPR